MERQFTRAPVAFFILEDTGLVHWSQCRNGQLVGEEQPQSFAVSTRTLAATLRALSTELLVRFFDSQLRTHHLALGQEEVRNRAGTSEKPHEKKGCRGFDLNKNLLRDTEDA